jgi:signal transduction histidine kinase/CheY-like chemotaxis protein
MHPDCPPPDVSRDGGVLARLFDLLQQGLFVGEVGTGGDRTLAANPHLKLMLGLAPETPDEDVHPLDAKRFVDPQGREALVTLLWRDMGVRDHLLRLRRADATPVWIEMTAHAEPLAMGGGVRLFALLRDVSERRRLDDQARELYSQLVQAEKLASLGQTISGVAHELNNPLATILASAERLVRLPTEAPIKRGLDAILSESERAAKIVRNLLTFARKRQTTRTMVDVNDVIRDTLALRQYEQRVANISVIEGLAAGLPPVFADPHQLQQVLLNLVINAEQAMISSHGRGTLVIRSWQDSARDAVAIEVADDGPGVPEDVMPRIFDPFFTTKEVGQGTGLGLSVAYAIVEEHGGTISANSRPEGGAAFVIGLPTGGAPLQSPARKAMPAPEPVEAGAVVLVVEDEAALASAVADALTDAGFLVERAGDGAEALALVTEKTYDLVICDLRMPRVDGPAFYRAIAARSPELARRVIFVTGDVVGTDAERFLEESGCPWLAKPFRLADLLRLARGVLG